MNTFTIKTLSTILCFGALIAVANADTRPTSSSANQNTSLLTVDPWYLTADGKWITHVYLKSNPDNIRIRANNVVMYGIPDWYLNRTAITIRPAGLIHNPIVVNAEDRHTHRVVAQIIIRPPSATLTGLSFRARAIGPHLVTMGWFNFNRTQQQTQYQIYRKEELLPEKLLTKVDSTQNTYHDDTVAPNHQYTYRVSTTSNTNQPLSAQMTVKTPPELRSFPVTAMRGIGATFFFDTDPPSQFYYKRIDPVLFFSRVKQLGMRYIELRTSYGTFSHFSDPNIVKWVDKMLDAAHDQGIQVFSWSIPQRETSSSIASDVMVASHVSPNGNTFAGIALDLEIEKSYMVNLPEAGVQQEISNYIKMVRQAVGPHYLFSVILYSPLVMELHDFPFRVAGQYASIVQPMEFWHHHLATSHHYYSHDEVANAIINTLKYLRQYVGTNVPINIIGQISDEEENTVVTGDPSATEVTTALQAAKDNGALGVSFYTWTKKLFLANGQLSPQAQAVKNFSW